VRVLFKTTADAYASHTQVRAMDYAEEQPTETPTAARFTFRKRLIVCCDGWSCLFVNVDVEKETHSPSRYMARRDYNR
jgi:hypothetical protein